MKKRRGKREQINVETWQYKLDDKKPKVVAEIVMNSCWGFYGGVESSCREGEPGPKPRPGPG